MISLFSTYFPVVAGNWQYIRGCDSNQYVPYSQEIDEIEFCETDRCNSANSQLPILVTFIAPILVGIYNFMKFY